MQRRRVREWDEVGWRGSVPSTHPHPLTPCIPFILHPPKAPEERGRGDKDREGREDLDLHKPWCLLVVGGRQLLTPNLHVIDWGLGAQCKCICIYIYEPDTFSVYLASLLYMQYKIPS